MRLRLLSRRETKTLAIPGTSFELREPKRDDYEAWVALRKLSTNFLKPWEPTWPTDDLTPIGFQRRLRVYARQRQNGTGQTFFLHDNSANLLMGGLSLSRIVHGFTRSAMLGYWMGVEHAGKGHMQKAVPALLDYAFSTLRLRRVEAACIPTNARSIHLLTKCGFHKEGYARQYLEISGKREDHILFAILKSEFALMKD
ncbi:MAG: GNAT family protein [Pseudomonadota bacterium]